MNAVNKKSNIEQIKESFSLLEIANDHGIVMKKVGKNHRGLCPFHNENSPSFFINEEKKIFKCFGCGKSGDVINFYSLLKGLSNKQTIKILSNLLGLNNTGRYKVEVSDLVKKRAMDKEAERKFKEAYRLLTTKLDDIISSFKTIISSFTTIEEIEEYSDLYHEYSRLLQLQDQVFDVSNKEAETEMYFILKNEFLSYKPLLAFMQQGGAVR